MTPMNIEPIIVVATIDPSASRVSSRSRWKVPRRRVSSASTVATVVTTSPARSRRWIVRSWVAWMPRRRSAARSAPSSSRAAAVTASHSMHTGNNGWPRSPRRSSPTAREKLANHAASISCVTGAVERPMIEIGNGMATRLPDRESARDVGDLDELGLRARRLEESERRDAHRIEAVRIERFLRRERHEVHLELTVAPADPAYQSAAVVGEERQHPGLEALEVVDAVGWHVHDLGKEHRGTVAAPN